ncbi:MAG: hypothetical protein IJ647_08585 [Prevotella sp.]|nr:hypothetical protein [Prevotella sp.]
MRKIYLFAGLAAMMLASCSSKDSLDIGTTSQPVTADSEIPVGFDIYTQRTTTRAGVNSEMTTGNLGAVPAVGSESKAGFGVFGYYTDNKDYDQLALPNFFYNQQVFAKTSPGDFVYEPVKYWPNEYGSTAVSDDNDKVSFFAYAPYVVVNTSNGKVEKENEEDDKWGITQLSRNTASGDPIVKYITSFDNTKAVDLCWGVCEQDNWININNGQKQTFDQGKPWLDVQRPSTVEQKLKFTFYHALAKMNVKIDHFTDDTKSGKDLESETRIFVRSVRFNGIAQQGALNLNNETPRKPYWMNYNGVGDLESDGELIVYDKRRDGKEAMANANATNEKSTGLNPELIQDENTLNGTGWAAGGHTGVTKTPQPLFNGSGTFYVIPVEGEEIEVEIVYDVETVDANLGTTLADGKTPGSSIENRISKKINFGSSTSIEAGKSYQINLHLGMNSVKFDAAVMGWDEMASPDIDLPANLAQFAGGAAGTTANADILGSDLTYVFAVTGLVGGEAVTVTNGAKLTNGAAYSQSDWATGADQANASGVVYVKADHAAYKGVVHTVGAPDIKVESASGKEVTLSLRELAVALNLIGGTSSATGTTVTLVTTADTEVGTDWLALPTGSTAGTVWDDVNKKWNDDTMVRVWVNGAELQYVTTDPTANSNEFTINAATGVITLGTSLTAGDSVKVYLKTGDVAGETITITAS